jgi:purine nucleosidase
VSAARLRVIRDNDYSGDADGLFQLAHHLVSRSVEVRPGIGRSLVRVTLFDPSRESAVNVVRKAEEIIGLLGLSDNAALSSATTPIPSGGARAIIAEAMRTDTGLPLSVTPLAPAHRAG